MVDMRPGRVHCLTHSRSPLPSCTTERTIAVVPTKGMTPISFAEADRLAAEDDSPFAKAFRAELSADPAERRIDAIVAWAMTGGAK